MCSVFRVPPGRSSNPFVGFLQPSVIDSFDVASGVWEGGERWMSWLS